jgi:hypothetical protein
VAALTLEQGLSDIFPETTLAALVKAVAATFAANTCRSRPGGGESGGGVPAGQFTLGACSAAALWWLLCQPKSTVRSARAPSVVAPRHCSRAATDDGVHAGGAEPARDGDAGHQVGATSGSPSAGKRRVKYQDEGTGRGTGSGRAAPAAAGAAAAAAVQLDVRGSAGSQSEGEGEEALPSPFLRRQAVRDDGAAALGRSLSPTRDGWRGVVGDRGTGHFGPSPGPPHGTASKVLPTRKSAFAVAMGIRAEGVAPVHVGQVGMTFLAWVGTRVGKLGLPCPPMGRSVGMFCCMGHYVRLRGPHQPPWCGVG